MPFLYLKFGRNYGNHHLPDALSSAWIRKNPGTIGRAGGKDKTMDFRRPSGFEGVVGCAVVEKITGAVHDVHKEG